MALHRIQNITPISESEYYLFSPRDLQNIFRDYPEYAIRIYPIAQYYELNLVNDIIDFVGTDSDAIGLYLHSGPIPERIISNHPNLISGFYQFLQRISFRNHPAIMETLFIPEILLYGLKHPEITNLTSWDRWFNDLRSQFRNSKITTTSGLIQLARTLTPTGNLNRYSTPELQRFLYRMHQGNIGDRGELIRKLRILSQ